MKKFIIICLGFLLPDILLSQTEKQLIPSDLKQRSVVTEPATVSKGFFRAGFHYYYGALDKLFDDQAKKHYLDNSTWGSSSELSLMLDYGITDRLAVNLNIPYAMIQTISYIRVSIPELNNVTDYSVSLKGYGLGDVTIMAKYQIIAEKENRGSLIGTLVLTVPTGRKNFTNIISPTEYDLPTGNGYFSPEAELKYRLVKYPFSYAGYASYRYNCPGSVLMTASDITETEFRQGNSFRTGGTVAFHLNEWIALQNSLEFYYQGEKIVESQPLFNVDARWNMNYTGILNFQVKKFRIGEGFYIPIKGKILGADPMLVVVTQYVF